MPNKVKQQLVQEMEGLTIHFDHFDAEAQKTLMELPVPQLVHLRDMVQTAWKNGFEWSERNRGLRKSA